MDQTHTLSFSAVRDFVKRQKATGRYNSATARNLEAACAHVEPVLEPGSDTVGYVSDHLDEIIQRYGNLNQQVGQASLGAYRARVRRAIADFVGHRTDPQWRPTSRPKRSVPEIGGPVSVSAPKTPTHSSISAESPGALRHRLPLRPDFDVEITLPRDFTGREAKRVLAWITALAGEDRPEGAMQ
jgi:hypothetical protein